MPCYTNILLHLPTPISIYHNATAPQEGKCREAATVHYSWLPLAPRVSLANACPLTPCWQRLTMPKTPSRYQGQIKVS